MRREPDGFHLTRQTIAATARDEIHLLSRLETLVSVLCDDNLAAILLSDDDLHTIATAHVLGSCLSKHGRDGA